MVTSLIPAITNVVITKEHWPSKVITSVSEVIHGFVDDHVAFLLANDAFTLISYLGQTLKGYIKFSIV